MDRRTFLATGIATGSAATLAGCGGGAPIDLAMLAERWPAEGRFVEAMGLRIHAWERGSGQPVILLHGASGNLRDWTYSLAPMIARRRRAIAFDRPGNGYSERPAEWGGDPVVQARILRAAAQEMGAERPILVGHSWGAALALAWALAFPNEVAGVVTVAGAVMPWSEQPMLAEFIGLDRLLIGFYFDYLQSSRGGVEGFVRRIFRPQVPPAGYVDYIGGPLALRTETLKANMEDIGALNRALRRLAPDYPSLGVPVEIISGTEDFIIQPERQPIPLAAAVPRSRLTLLDGVGHMAHHAAPAELLGALDRIAART
jgi:pimeloyl-ACP methyl ester carboxylesterase